MDEMKSYRIRRALKKLEKILMENGALLDLEYIKADEKYMERRDEAEKELHPLFPGDEYILIRSAVDGHLYYEVNVTGDSVLTAVSEAMQLLARKF